MNVHFPRSPFFAAAWMLLAVAVVARGQTPTTLVAKGSTWRYRDNGSDGGTAWREPGFADGGWSTGAAPLGYSNTPGAYGSFPLGTTISYGPNASFKYVTTYFRQAFTVANPAAFSGLTLRLLRDDGAVVYVNGIEAGRLGMAAGTVAYDTFANELVTTATGYDTLTVGAQLLVAGANTLAVEIHQMNRTSSDVVMDAELLGSPAFYLARGPYLQMNGSSAVTLRWRTNTATDSRVWFGARPASLTNSVSDATLTTEHEVRLTELQPDTEYFYAVGSTPAGPLTGGDANTSFRTAPTPGTDRTTRVWVLGDCGTNTANQRAVRDGYYTSAQFRRNDLVLLLGDNAYETGLDSEYQVAIFDMYAAVLRQSAVWSCLGNHDTAQATGGSYTNAYFDLFTFPTNAECGGYPSSTERYFSWDHGDIHFVSLDSQTTDSTLRAAMLTWLQNDLAVNQRRWTIALWHHPPYSHGSHNSDTDPQLVWMRENVVPILENGGVDLVLTGHSHAYERSYFLDGYYGADYVNGNVAPHKKDAGDGRPEGNGAYGKDAGSHLGAVYAVTGSAGQVSGGTLDHPAMFISLGELGSMFLDVGGSRLDAKFLGPGPNAVVRDGFTILKGPLVSVATPAPNAAEYGPVSGQFTLSRSGATTNPLVVQFALGGSAPSSRYQPPTPPAIIPAGASMVSVPITPIPDSIFQGPQTVNLTLQPAAAYRLGATTAGIVTIDDMPAGAPSIARWKLAKFGAQANNPAIAGDNADPEGDGIVNLLEYALDTDPFASSVVSLPVAETTSGYLTLTVHRNPAATDVTYAVQVNGDLSNGGSWSSADTTVLQDTPSLLQVRDNVPIGGANAPRRFIRLRVTQP